MQTTIQIDFTSEIVDCGYIGEHNAVRLEVAVPSDMLSDEHIYRLAFEIGELSARSGVLTATDGNVSYDVPLSVASTRVVNMQLEEYASDESFIKKSALVILRFANSVPNGTVGIDNDAGIVAEISANTAARHGHDNKPTLDKLGESGGSLTFDGAAIGGSSDLDKAVGFFTLCKSISNTIAVKSYIGSPEQFSDSGYDEEGYLLGDGFLSMVINSASYIGDFYISTTANGTVKTWDGDYENLEFAVTAGHCYKIHGNGSGNKTSVSEVDCDELIATQFN